MPDLRQSTAVTKPIGPFLDETDGKTIEDSLTITQPDIRLKKNDSNWAQKAAAQTLTHEEFGWYEVLLDATDTNTVGDLVVAVHESGALPVFMHYNVLPTDVYDAKYASTTLQAATATTATLASAESTVDQYFTNQLLVIVSGTGAGQAGRVHYYTGSTRVALIVPPWRTTPDNTSKYVIVPDAAPVSVYRNGTATAGGAASITLDASASTVTDEYVKRTIGIVGGTGGGQAAECTAYNGTTKVATIAPAWNTTPSSDSKFLIY